MSRVVRLAVESYVEFAVLREPDLYVSGTPEAVRNETNRAALGDALRELLTRIIQFALEQESDRMGRDVRTATRDEARRRAEQVIARFDSRGADRLEFFRIAREDPSWLREELAR